MTAFSTAGWTRSRSSRVIAVVAVAAFVVQERRSPEPMISLGLWGRRPIAAVNAASLFAGMVMIGLTTFLPMFVQGVMGRPPLIAGLRAVGDGAGLADRRDAVAAAVEAVRRPRRCCAAARR